MSKVTVVGAGMVGATCANVLACRNIASEVVLVDIKEGLSEGKMLDMFQASATIGYKTKLVGVTATDAEGYKPTANSDVVVITSGIPRKPGMTREELIGINANIVKSVVNNVIKWSPKAIFVIISNPMDTMAYLTLKAAGIPKRRVIGMGGALDSSRFRCYLSKASGVGIQDIEGMVIGGHGDTTMIPLTSKASIKGVPASKFLSKAKLAKVAADTMVGGATLTGMLGTSAWYAPGAAGASVVDAIINDTKAIVPCSVYLEGEYGQDDIFLGVPVVLGKKGIEKIVKVELTKEEAAQFAASAAAVRKVNEALYEIGALTR
ncbi:MAG: malate dehydrogenase [Alistipes sp.]|nr:malate dehydrogenase [Alistipes sp.]